MNAVFSFSEVARLPMPGDNVAIATRRLEAGTGIDYEGRSFTLSHTVMEGHRFAVEPIEPGQFLLSWQLPFGVAERALQPGDYACNQSMLDALGIRQLDFDLPEQANFVDRIEPYQLDPANFQPGVALDPHEERRTFLGYGRSGGRGVGTRNYIVVLGTSSRTASYARLLAERWSGRAAGDGVVPIAHTEGGGGSDPNNRELLLRTLAGFVVHPNVGAVLAVDYGSEAVTNKMLREYMVAHGYALDHVRHCFMSLDGSFAARLAEGERQVAAWAEEMAGEERGEHDSEPSQDRLAVRRLGRLFGHFGESAGRLGGARVDSLRRRSQPRRDRRADRCRTVRAAKRQGCGDCAHLFAHDRALQGAGVVARCLSRGQSLWGQQISRAVQYRAQVHWRGAQARSRRAFGLRH